MCAGEKKKKKGREQGAGGKETKVNIKDVFHEHKDEIAIPLQGSVGTKKRGRKKKGGKV